MFHTYSHVTSRWKEENIKTAKKVSGFLLTCQSVQGSGPVFHCAGTLLPPTPPSYKQSHMYTGMCEGGMVVLGLDTGKGGTAHSDTLPILHALPRINAADFAHLGSSPVPRVFHKPHSLTTGRELAQLASTFNKQIMT